MPNRGNALLALLLATMIFLNIIFCFIYINLLTRVQFAEEQVQVFAAMREKARSCDVQNATRCLEYTLDYYPAGTKQIVSTPLSNLVETVRFLAVDDIMATLRNKSKDDLGTDPTVWIKTIGTGTL